MLRIDLAALDGDGTNLGFRSDGGYTIQSWILVAAAAGGVCLLVLVVALTLVACRLHGNGNDEKRHPDSTRIRADKHGPPGTDV